MTVCASVFSRVVCDGGGVQPFQTETGKKYCVIWSWAVEFALKKIDRKKPNLCVRVSG